MIIYEKTLMKFGYPGSIIKRYKLWTWLLRPEQVTLGSCIIIPNNHFSNFSDLSQDAFSELKQVTTEIERCLSESFNYNKINYLMLMMNDPTVHFHIFPRYSKSITHKGKIFEDKGYPSLPKLNVINKCSIKEHNNILTTIKNKIK